MPNLERFPLGTHYTHVVQSIIPIIRQINEPPLSIMVDQTGVGRAVLSQLLEVLYRTSPWKLHACTIIAGAELADGENGGMYAPKRIGRYAASAAAIAALTDHAFITRCGALDSGAEKLPVEAGARVEGRTP